MIPFPDKKYNIIYAAPPWDIKAGPGYNSNGKSRDLVYPSMSIDEIKAMPVKDICLLDCHLYMWIINKYIPEAYEIAKAWGFKPSAMLTWCKAPMGLGLGGAFVQTTEHLLYCRKGKLKTQKRMDTTRFEHKRTKHSVKPQLFRDMIVEISGDVPRIELFARQRHIGWDAWGNEV